MGSTLHYSVRSKNYKNAYKVFPDVEIFGFD